MEAGGKQYILHGSRADVFRIYFISDIHLFNKACATKRIKADIQTIKDDPYAFWFGVGDYAEYISYTDKRFDPACVSERLKVADLDSLGKVTTDAVLELFKPIAHKCLGLCLGNHEYKYLTQKEQMYLHGWLCTAMSAPNLEYSAISDIVFCRKSRTKIPKLARETPGKVNGTQSFRVYLHHGSGGAQTPGGKLNRLIKFMHAFDADIYCVGHVHDQIVKRIPVVGASPDCTKIIDKAKLGIISGSYLKTYEQGSTTYGERAGYSPVPLGCRCVVIKPESREIHGEI